MITSNANLTGKLQTGIVFTGVAVGATGESCTDYEKLKNLPKIESVELKGNKTFKELGLNDCSNLEIDELFRR